MGQQQLLLIVMGVIIVGVAILMGINIYRDNAIQTAKNHLISDCMNIITIAQKYYWTPKGMGGGGMSFNGSNGAPEFEIPNDLKNNNNGRYEISSGSLQEGEFEITATGYEVIVNDEHVVVKVKVYPKTFTVVSED